MPGNLIFLCTIGHCTFCDLVLLPCPLLMDSTFGITELVCYEAPSGVDLRDVNLGIDINRAMLMMFMFLGSANLES